MYMSMIPPYNSFIKKTIFPPYVSVAVIFLVQCTCSDVCLNYNGEGNTWYACFTCLQAALVQLNPKECIIATGETTPQVVRDVLQHTNCLLTERKKGRIAQGTRPCHIVDVAICI